MDYRTISAGLMHDVIEDTPCSYQEMADNFDKEIAELVDCLLYTSDAADE
mgnify:CR=1 FL=1